MDVEALVRPVVESVGLELWGATYRKENGRMVLRVTVDRAVGVDRADGVERTVGVDLYAIAEASEKISRRLDLEGFGGSTPYALEVTSPGLERPLHEPRQFERSVGQQVRVKTLGPPGVVQGALVSAGADAVVIASEGGELRVPYVEIASARTVFEWGSSSRPAGRRGAGSAKGSTR
jgi:ribosome maturation factor RimP